MSRAKIESRHTKSKQVAFSKKAAELNAGASKAALSQALLDANREYLAEQSLAPNGGRDQHNRERAHGPRAPPAKQVATARQATQLSARLLTRHEIVALAGRTYPTLWQMMRRGEFPRSRIVGGTSMWLSTEVDAWLANLPVRPLKGDDAAGAAE